MSNSGWSEVVFVSAMMALIIIGGTIASLIFLRTYRREMREKEENRKQKTENRKQKTESRIE